MTELNGCEVDMQIIRHQTEAQRHREYRQRKGDSYRAANKSRMHQSRADKVPEFFGIDTEGIGKGKNHRAVLISCFDKNGRGQHGIARDLRNGLQWEEIFGFLYSQFEAFPQASFIGFFLGYDFNKWLCHESEFPQKAATSLLTKAGKAARKRKDKTVRNKYYAVKVGRWEVDILGFKRLSIRPRPDNCWCYEEAIPCTHKQLPWMHICDSGPFFQMSLLSLLEPSRWADDPDGPICTSKEYSIILKGKNRRDHAKLDQEMLDYNKLENMILCRIMERMAKGFASVHIKLAKDQWYGPGATASKWLQQKGIPKHSALRMKDDEGNKPLIPKWFWEACHASYYGGWFEIFSHGSIYGTSYNYDINNAYPFAASKLPHICRECKYLRGEGEYNGTGEYVLLYQTVFTKGDRIGAVPYRNKTGGILRPRISKGWYWKHEIDAAKRAGIVKKVMAYEWIEFVPCEHPKPLTEIQELYNLRLEKGKDSALGMSIKLNNNSIYGKFAQSVGSRQFNNWLYASYITSHCRTQILDAIATHSGGTDSVLMVATDGICFDSPHGNLPISKKLGEWAESEYNDLVLFKPGVYWHVEGKDKLLKVKSRGVPKTEFLEACEMAELDFYGYAATLKVGNDSVHYILGIDSDAWVLEKWRKWPWFLVTVNFRMRSVRQSLNENNWEGSGEVMEEVRLKQDSDPSEKRRQPIFNFQKNRIDTIIHDLPIKELQTTYHGNAEVEKEKLFGFNFDGNTPFSGIIEASSILRDAPVNYNLSIAESEWITVWENGMAR